MRMAWAFRARFPRASVTSVTVSDERPLSRGVHGIGGSWLVNGSADGLVVIRMNPPGRGRVLGFPLSLRELTVSVDEPAALIAAMGR